jgi:hypothetical protein
MRKHVLIEGVVKSKKVDTRGSFGGDKAAGA